MGPPNLSFSKLRSAFAALQQPILSSIRQSVAGSGAKAKGTSRLEYGREYFRSKTPYLLALAASGGLGGLCMALADAPAKSSPIEGTAEQAEDTETRKKKVVILGSGWGATAVMQVSQHALDDAIKTLILLLSNQCVCGHTACCTQEV
jgi:hypothetical protein